MRRLYNMMIAIFAFIISTILFAGDAFAQGATTGAGSDNAAYIAIAAALTIAVASLGGAIGQGKVATAAMEGISRNPEAASKVMTPMIIALALIESLVIYALVIAFLLQGKI